MKGAWYNVEVRISNDSVPGGFDVRVEQLYCTSHEEARKRSEEIHGGFVLSVQKMS